MGRTGERLIRLLLAAVAGMIPVAVGDARGTPGDGSFALAAVAAGFCGMLIAPGWIGLAALLGGMLIADLGGDGLIGFPTVVYGVLLSYGALVAVAVRRVIRPPRGAWSRDPLTLAAATGAVLIGAALASLAIDMARNPF